MKLLTSRTIIITKNTKEAIETLSRILLNRKYSMAYSIKIICLMEFFRQLLKTTEEQKILELHK